MEQGWPQGPGLEEGGGISCGDSASPSVTTQEEEAGGPGQDS